MDGEQAMAPTAPTAPTAARGSAQSSVRSTPTPAALAKGALRRLAQAQQEPTPENYARAYAEEAGAPAPALPAADLRAAGQAWVTLIERLARNLERGGRQWTGARRKDSLKRLFDGSRSDAQRLQQRLQSLMTAWETDGPAEADLAAGPDAVPVAPAAAAAAAAAAAGDWLPLVGSLQHTVRAALPPALPRAAALAQRLATLADAVASDGATSARVAAIDAVCQEAQRLFGHRHRLVDELGGLCRELGAGLTELSEDDSWARGQCLGLQATLDEEDGPSVRGLRSAAVLLAETRARQQKVRDERAAARDALRRLITDMLVGVGEVGEQAGRLQRATAEHVQAIEKADSLEGLATVMQTMLQEARSVQDAVGQSRQRLQAGHDRAAELEGKVRELEGELRRLSEEVSTDALTQVANRRGLTQAFDAEAARCAREAAAGGAPLLAVGLIDIDNFKKLNDSLGHAAGDEALKTLAAAVRERLRPADHLARFGGEEFVVLLPATDVAEAQQVLTRLQRSLSQALFMHDGREVFVTFSAGVTAWCAGESLALALERADEALYDAKRNGKNRTCIG